MSKKVFDTIVKGDAVGRGLCRDTVRRFVRVVRRRSRRRKGIQLRTGGGSI